MSDSASRENVVSFTQSPAEEDRSQQQHINHDDAIKYSSNTVTDMMNHEMNGSGMGKDIKDLNDITNSASDDEMNKDMTKISASASEGKASTQAYRHYYQLLSSEYKDQPSLDIIYKDLSYTITLPKKSFETPNVLKSLLSIPIGIFNTITRRKKQQYEHIHALQAITGRIQAGTATLILAPPGK
jgi:hypothetical protein